MIRFCKNPVPLILLLVSSARAQHDSLRIAEMVASVSAERLMETVRTLEGFGTRFEFAPERDQAAEWLIGKFQAAGLATTSDWYTINDHDSRNVVATLPGKSLVHEECIIVGHYDSRARGDTGLAPGADDNGTGTAAVMEAATILAEYEFSRTIRFLAVSGEELGLKGSEHYAAVAKAAERSIIGVVNGDMLAYPSTADTLRLVAASYPVVIGLVESTEVWNERYQVGLNLVTVADTVGPSDHKSFSLRDYDAVWFCEATFQELRDGSNPFYHSADDTAGNLHPGLFRRAVQLMVAAIAELARPEPSPAVSVSGPESRPLSLRLERNYPNPFNGATRISCTISASTNALLSVFDQFGREVARLHEGILTAGTKKSFLFDASGLASGVYYVRLVSAGATQSLPMLLVR